MSAVTTQKTEKMTVDEFMQWYETQEGKWELHNGIPVRKHDPAKGQSERIEHSRVKYALTKNLDNAIQKAKKKCEVLPDGMTVRIDDGVCYEPDAVVYCGEKLDGKALEVPHPVIIVEVLSPSTAWKDVGAKLTDYFTIETVQHYLIVDPVRESIQHHYRDGANINVEAVNEDTLELEPPGLKIDVSSLFS